MQPKTLQDVANALRNPLPDEVAMSPRGVGIFAETPKDLAYYLEENGYEVGPLPYDKRCFVCALGKVALDWGLINPDQPQSRYFWHIADDHPVLAQEVEHPAEEYYDALRSVISDLYEEHNWSLGQIADWVEGLAQ